MLSLREEVRKNIKNLRGESFYNLCVVYKTGRSWSIDGYGVDYRLTTGAPGFDLCRIRDLQKILSTDPEAVVIEGGKGRWRRWYLRRQGIAEDMVRCVYKDGLYIDVQDDESRTYKLSTLIGDMKRRYKID